MLPPRQRLLSLRGVVRFGRTACLLVSLSFAPALMSAPPPTPFDASSAINHFGLDLYRRLAPDHATGNLVLSPYSVATALALAGAGASGPTRTELEHALHFSAGETDVQAALAALRQALASSVQHSVEQTTQRKEDGDKTAEPIEFNVANRLFAQRGYPILPDYLARTEATFDSRLETLDFLSTPEPARQKINTWVEEQTHQRIRNLIPPGSITDRTRLVLVNALYFKAHWRTAFLPEATQPAPFQRPRPATQAAPVPAELVPMMHAAGRYLIFHTDHYSALTLPYLGRDFQFVIILPTPGVDLKKAAAELTPDALQKFAHPAPDDFVRASLYLPRFKVSGASLSLNPSLAALGVRCAFDQPRGSADFTRIAPRRGDDYLFFSDVFHQTFLALDENGTEAAAATAVVMMAGTAFDPKKPIEFRVDRPFLFAIQHVPTGACLFFGHIADPR